MEVSATLTSLTIVTDAREGRSVVFDLADRGPFAFSGLTAEVVYSVMVIAPDLTLPVPCVARFHGGRLVALRHPTEQRWAIFEDLPEPRVVQVSEDMVSG